jgi:hypothetical protein
MNTSNDMAGQKARDIASARSTRLEAEEAAAELASQWGGLAPRAIFFFCSPRHDGARLSAALRARYPQAEVLGCTTAGEFTQESSGVDSVTALALGAGKVRRCAGVLARFEGGVAAGVQSAVKRLGEALGVSLREADPSRYVGVMLVEGVGMHEEEVNAALGNAAPLLSFVGGSAGDNLAFRETRVFYNGEASSDGAVLFVLEAAVPFTVLKTCSFEPTGKVFEVTHVDVPQRVVYALEGRPVAQVYAEAVGVAPGQLDSRVFMSHPLGLMIDGKPWIRSPQQQLPDGGLRFYCQVLEGARMHLMRSTALVGETRTALEDARRELGGRLSGGLLFNCVLRRLEMDDRQLHGPFLETLRGLEVAGFHTYGESWLGHINQTLTALVFE